MLKMEKIDNKSSERKIIIATDNLSKYYGKGGEINAADEVSLKIFEGETFGLLGPNGAGKTTTIRLLNCIIKPTNGDATVKGLRISESPTEIKAITGLLAESPGLYDKLSPYEFLEFMGALYNLDGYTLKQRINDLLKLFSLDERKDYLLEGFSTGMKQKVLIAAALIHDPPILFFDEPTAGLDPRAAKVVKNLIEGLADQADKTVVICSHILPIVEELCDRIGIIDQGKLIAVGTIADIVAQTGKKTLEEAFISLTGGVDEKELMTWRNHSN